MRCFICDNELSSVTFNRDHGDINPCGTCLEVIANVFGSEPVPEEELADEPEPTTEELMNDAEDIAYGRIDVV